MNTLDKNNERLTIFINHRGLVKQDSQEITIKEAIDLVCSGKDVKMNGGFVNIDRSGIAIQPPYLTYKHLNVNKHNVDIFESVATDNHEFKPYELIIEDFNGHMESIDFSTTIENLIGKGYNGIKDNHIKTILYKPKKFKLHESLVLFDFEQYYKDYTENDFVSVDYRFVQS